MKIKKPNFTLFLMLTVFAFSCQEDVQDIIIEDEEEVAAPVNSDYFDDTISDAMSNNKADHEEEGDSEYDVSNATIIQLNGNSITVTGSDVEVDGTLATITNSGTFMIQGTLNDGQIAVDTESEETVKIILNSTQVSNSTNAPFNVISAEKVIVYLPDGSNSIFTDAAEYVYADEEEDEPNAAFFSKADLSFYGSGAITVNANYNDGITSKDGLVIGGGSFKVTSVDDGIRGKDYLVINDGEFTLATDGDAMKSDNDDDEDRGYILVNGGNFKITTSAGDGFSAETDLMITDGTFELTTGGGSGNFDEDISAKGLKAGVNNLLEGGLFTIDAADDGIHCDGNMAIQNGTFTIASGDDGIHADEQLTINSGTITITESYEGLESNIITINDGEIHIVSSDDGINAAGGADSSGTRPGQSNSFSSSSDSYIYFQGGYIFVDADGDGIDANGSISMTAGTILVNGPSSNGNGAIDYDRTFQISGGILLAVGSSNMAQAPSNTSDQNSILATFSQQSANTPVSILSSDGTNLLTYVPTKSFSSLVLSSPDFTDGSQFSLYTGGSVSGTGKDGFYENGNYTQGNLVSSFTITSNVVVVK